MHSLLSSLDGWFAPAPDPARVNWLRTGVYAHRGLHGPGAVENSPTAFSRAVEAGFGIECDVQLTADGQVVVFHDFDLGRLTGQQGAVVSRSAPQLERIGLSGSHDSIPTLKRLLEQIGGRVPLLIEIKMLRDSPAGPVCRAVRQDLEVYGGRHAVMSFDPRVSRWFSLNAPDVVRGLVMSEADSGPALRHFALLRSRAEFLAYDIRDLPSGFAVRQQHRGLPLLTWTVRDRAQAGLADSCAATPIAEGDGVAASGIRR